MECDMGTILLYCICGIGIAFFLALVLPVRLYLHVSGGTEESLDVSARILFFNGCIGTGLSFGEKRYSISLFIVSRRVASCSLTPFMKYISEKRKKQKLKKPAAPKETVPQKPLLERIKTLYQTFQTYKGYIKRMLAELGGLFRIDLFSADVLFGLGNPALTGKLIGILYAVNSILPHPYMINPSWNFTKMAFQGKLTVQMTFFSHVFWKKIITQLPSIISAVRQIKRRKYSSHTSLIVQEV
jgi:hypothetical protein